ncbi:hypothetical protein BKA61DRAFT_463605 [Leptodontidium sp. MPI-SDFR-AT-0119]|nr:hypothetical protein BKA61DRAFT_463605 [Leptodontidium sp. MPI-SDFR-AT-0119]
MATLQFPPRQCLTCATNGAACDGGFPVCMLSTSLIGSYCKKYTRGCRKPKIEVQVPWDKTPSLPSGADLQVPSPTDDVSFTEEYIKSEHKDLIDVITSIYEMLKSMAYISALDIKYPPHRNLPMAQLAAIGLEPEARALLRHIPYLDVDHDNEIEISKDTNAYSYLSDVNEAREVLWEGGNDLAPWAIRLSHWYTNTYLDLPSSTPEEVFGRWIGFLRDLKEIPWREGDERSIKSEPPAPPYGYLDYVGNGYVIPEVSVAGSNVVNEEYKKLFRDYGWPDAFKIEEFMKMRRKIYGSRESESECSSDSDWDLSQLDEGMNTLQP